LSGDAIYDQPPVNLQATVYHHTASITRRRSNNRPASFFISLKRL